MGMRNPSGAVARTAPVARGSEQDAMLRSVSDHLAEKGFVVAQFEKLVNWARSGSLWPMSFGLACYRLWTTYSPVPDFSDPILWGKRPM